ncbi:Selenocysteine-specific translation elongation factor [Serinicoccus hydrothermalis]|uniref:Selenocysteine-specific translation elongation factor n=1 Tax=Serinicoccus hydrothermalis TaxID=1758689 RepID=A0A1B1NBA7_9MICO|nr:selenocysteine-specific translation elongation factor [Serinicoccus hydrothermalis]ANS78665.1 Selenocysteine-specific translation elongation factor [Serinicoccus hydrothermalis]
MTVVATAGHVDHGKSALVRALTGMEPDRWAEERRRGLTLDLGYAWTTLPRSGAVAFVDVPGHRRFIGNMLSGLGPSAAVLLVVAADGGWSAQSTEHLLAAHALRLRHGVLAVTRCDLADPGPALAEARERLAGTSLSGIPAACVSARTGEGLEDLRSLLDSCVAGMPVPPADAPVRLWVDRSFTVRGAGTVVTGTLPAGSVAAGDRLLLTSARGSPRRPVLVRGLQTLGRDAARVGGPARVALNLRGVEVDEVGRGQALLGGERPWWPTSTTDVLLDADVLPARVSVHVGTAAVPGRLRVLEACHARLHTEAPLPLVPGDRVILRDPGREGALVGAEVLDAVVPPLRRSGAARRRAAALRQDAHGVELDGRVVTAATARLWGEALAALVRERADADPLDPWLPLGTTLTTLRHQVGVPDRATLEAVAARQQLAVRDDRVGPTARHDRGPAHPPTAVPDDPPGLTALLHRLARDPLDAPNRPELEALGIGGREIAAASGRGTVLRLPGEVLLGAQAPARALAALADLPQPFTTSAARTALGVSRRVAIALLEHLDARGHTLRDAADTRRLLTRDPSS